MKVEPNAIVVNPIAFMRLFMSQWPWPFSSWYSVTPTEYTKLAARTWVLYHDERRRETMMLSRRKMMAFWSVMRPAGSGRQGLLSLSSSKSRVWFARLNWRRWSQLQNTTWRIWDIFLSESSGAAPTAKAPYHDIQMLNVRLIGCETYHGQYCCFKVIGSEKN